jgi:hypothetical protein
MKRVIGFVLIAAVVITAGAAVTQQSAPRPPGPQMPMQGGMCPMMSGMMGSGGMMSGGTMGMMGGQAESPRMLQMRGEMLKAMGEIMMKHGKMTEGGPR